MKTYTFATRMRCRLTNDTVVITRNVRVEATSEAQARSYLPALAWETCDDAGSRWFDAPLESVQVLEAWL